MEGTVVDLGDGRIAKIWHSRSERELVTLRSFYEALSLAGPGVMTPRIHRVLELDGQAATVETLLEGRPLRDSMGDDAYHLSATATACVVDVLDALAHVVPTDAMKVLPVLEGEPAFDGRQPFERSLADLVERRAQRFRGPLSSRIHDLDDVVAATVACLTEPEPAPPRLIHGDLIPANILVDDATRPVATLDFGFLTTVGDSAFDAAVTASIYDMYGPRAAVNEAILDEAIVDRFGYEPRRLLIYRSAYALASSNCFSPSGTDGHFEWCLSMLARPQLREALDL